MGKGEKIAELAKQPRKLKEGKFYTKHETLKTDTICGVRLIGPSIHTYNCHVVHCDHRPTLRGLTGEIPISCECHACLEHTVQTDLKFKKTPTKESADPNP